MGGGSLGTVGKYKGGGDLWMIEGVSGYELLIFWQGGLLKN